ncbi:MarR family transcriptional regulator [Pullulanibacillus camelliae]|uniref:MarR family transcriptional regulator n=1 Tax=Pullulanibacillus camelliae TaxID=1707096 RepID=A0A8J2VN24_9BACL|nr:MarR family transcriptional regulator [Pullulanibacillus camelliae]GGE39531.1 MarR family transcriptional regulator [Pullulanibacillus camelliae]
MAEVNLFTFIRLNRSINREVRQKWNFYLSSPQIQLIESLDSDGPKTMSHAATELGISVGAMTALADRMVRSGIIERQRSADDRRVIHLVITDKGRDLIKDISISRSTVLEKYFGKLTPEEAKEMIRLCSKMLED